MIPSQKIEVYFAEIMQLSEQLCLVANALKAISENELMQIVCENKTCWNSQCGDILTQKEVKISRGLKLEADRLEKISREMERQAKRMYRSELVNVQRGATRIY